MLTEACCFDMGDCDHKSNDSTICPPCGQLNHEAWVANGECDGFLFTPECCYDGGDCGCPTCPKLDADIISDGRCDWRLDTSESCYDGGDCRCVEVTHVTSECCPESESVWCFPPNSVCPTCPVDLVDLLSNLECDEWMNEDCCFDAEDCLVSQFKPRGVNSWDF